MTALALIASLSTLSTGCRHGDDETGQRLSIESQVVVAGMAPVRGVLSPDVTACSINNRDRCLTHVPVRFSLSEVVEQHPALGEASLEDVPLVGAVFDTVVSSEGRDEVVLYLAPWAGDSVISCGDDSIEHGDLVVGGFATTANIFPEERRPSAEEIFAMGSAAVDEIGLGIVNDALFGDAGPDADRSLCVNR